MICPKCKEKVFLRDDCPSCGYRFFPEKKEPDDLLPFREAAKLGCKDFGYMDRAGRLLGWKINGVRHEQLPSTDATTNRQAAACSLFFWTHCVHPDAIKMICLLEKWIEKHCPINQKKEPQSLTNDDKLNILWRERKT